MRRGASAAIQEISGAHELDDLIRSVDRGVVRYFWGTWCRPFRVLRPHLERFATTHADGWRFVGVHVEQNPGLVEEWSVKTSPTLIYLGAGRTGIAPPGLSSPRRSTRLSGSSDYRSTMMILFNVPMPPGLRRLLLPDPASRLRVGGGPA